MNFVDLTGLVFESSYHGYDRSGFAPCFGSSSEALTGPLISRRVTESEPPGVDGRRHVTAVITCPEETFNDRILEAKTFRSERMRLLLMASRRPETVLFSN